MSRFSTVFLLLAAACQPLESYGPDVGEYAVDAGALEAFPGARVDFESAAIFDFPDGGTYEIPFQSVGGVAVAGGDMVLGETDQVMARSAASRFSDAWPACAMPYSFDASASAAARSDFLAAAAHWHQFTGIQFVESDATDRVVVRGGEGCSSYVGRQGGTQALTLSPTCGVGAAVHEIGHAAGLYHEQSRSDRDQYIAVHEENVEPERRQFFRTYTSRGLPGLDLGPYDYTSIMHYSSFAFVEGTCNVGDPSGCGITHHDGSFITETQYSRLSTGDLAGVAALYPGCAANIPDDHGDTFADPTFPTGSVVGGVLETSGDRDMFVLTTTAEGEFVIYGGGSTDTRGTLYDSNGVLLTSDDDTGPSGNFLLAIEAVEGEQFFLEVAGQDDSVIGEYSMSWATTVAPPPEPEPVPGAVQVQLLAFFGSGSAEEVGELAAAQVDLYQITVDAGTEVELVVRSTGGTDTFGTLQDSDRVEITSNDDTDGLNFEVRAMVPPGVYFVEVRGYSPTTAGVYGLEFEALLTF